MRASIVAGIVGPLMTVAMGCHNAPRTPPVAIEPDTVAGVVSITGTAFEQRIVLRANGQVIIPLLATTSDSAALSRMGGVQVDVVGRWGPNLSFRVESFTAEFVERTPVVDGFVRKQGDRLVLETTHGTIPLGNPPTALRSMIGARVWIGGPLDKGPNTYGVIVPPRNP